MTTAPDLEPWTSFGLFSETIQDVAECSVSIYIENFGLRPLNPKPMVLKLWEEYQRLTQEVNAFERKDYLIWTEKKYLFFNEFCTHLLNSHYDEEQQVLAGVILYKKLEYVTRQLLKERNLAPGFTYVDFLAGIAHVIFFELHEKPLKTSEKDYCKMRSWQIQKVWQCVTLESESFKRHFIHSIDHSTPAMVMVASNIQLLEELFDPQRTFSPDELFAHLSNIKGILPGSLPKDPVEFHRLFSQFNATKSLSHVINPSLIEKSYEQLLLGQLTPVPICCWSLIKFKKWLTDVQKGIKELSDHMDEDCEMLFEQTAVRAHLNYEQKMNQFIHHYPKKTTSDKQYKSIVFGQLKALHSQYMDLSLVGYFQALQREEMAKIYFLDQCLLDVDLSKQVDQLEKSIVMNEMINFFYRELDEIDENLARPTLDLEDYKSKILKIGTIIPQLTIYQKLWCAFTNITTELDNKKPLVFIVEDFKSAIQQTTLAVCTEIFQQMHLQPISATSYNTMDQIEELRTLTLACSELGQDLSKYWQVLIDLLKIRRASLLTQQLVRVPTDQRPYSELQHQVIDGKSQAICFGYNKSPGFLNPMIQALNLSINFLDDRTKVEDFVRIVTSDDLDLVNEKIYLGCQTNEFKYVIKYLGHFFTGFTCANIGKSKIFISNNGHPITAACLYSSKTDNLQTKKRIENVFK